MSKPYHPSLPATLAIHTARHVTPAVTVGFGAAGADLWSVWTVAAPEDTAEDLAERTVVRVRTVQIRQFITRAAVVASAGDPAAGRLSFRTIPETCGDIDWMIGMLQDVPGNLNVWLPEPIYGRYCESLRDTFTFHELGGGKQIVFRRDETPLLVSPHTPEEDAPGFIFSGDGPLALVLASPAPSPLLSHVKATRLHAPDYYHQTHHTSTEVAFARGNGEPLPCAAFLLALP